MLKTTSYYKRSWTSGTPFSTQPSWADLSHLPPEKRDMIVRPDLAMVAMERILHRVEGELSAEEYHRESQRQRREERLEQLRSRHERRDEQQRKLGLQPPSACTEALRQHQGSRDQLFEVGAALRPQSPLAGAAAVERHARAAAELDQGAAQPNLSLRGTCSQHSCSSHQVLVDAHSGSAAGVAAGKSRDAGASQILLEHVTVSSSPLRRTKADQLSGIEGLLVPKFPAGPTSSAHTASVGQMGSSASLHMRETAPTHRQAASDDDDDDDDDDEVYDYAGGYSVDGAGGEAAYGHMGGGGGASSRQLSLPPSRPESRHDSRHDSRPRSRDGAASRPLSRAGGSSTLGSRPVG